MSPASGHGNWQSLFGRFIIIPWSRVQIPAGRPCWIVHSECVGEIRACTDRHGSGWTTGRVGDACPPPRPRLISGDESFSACYRSIGFSIVTSADFSPNRSAKCAIVASVRGRTQRPHALHLVPPRARNTLLFAVVFGDSTTSDCGNMTISSWCFILVFSFDSVFSLGRAAHGMRAPRVCFPGFSGRNREK